jgi:hypothetical protein
MHDWQFHHKIIHTAQGSKHPQPDIINQIMSINKNLMPQLNRPLQRS